MILRGCRDLGSLAAGVMMATLTTPQVQAQGAPEIPFIGPAAKAQIDRRYHPGSPHKALAITEAGGWGAAIDMPDLQSARTSALASCQRSNRRHPCVLAYEDDLSVLDANYEPAAMQRLAIDLLREVRLFQPNYASEERETGLAPSVTRKTGVLHAPTPPAVPGARTVTTNGLVNMFRSAPPVLINVLDWSEGAFAIPGTRWIPGLGAPGTSPAQAREVLEAAQPDKAAPVVFYCLSWECWLSYNAALLAIELGYRNVMWYRGGAQAWNDAGLPVVRTRLFRRLPAPG